MTLIDIINKISIDIKVVEAVNAYTKIMLMTGSNFKTVGDVANDSIDVGGTADTKAEPGAWSSAAVHSTRLNPTINIINNIAHNEGVVLEISERSTVDAQIAEILTHIANE